MSKALPIYSINEFQSLNLDSEFYANLLNPHVKEHHFTRLPHKHDFYLIVLITGGSGMHEIDFESYSVVPGMLFILKPGQMHFWKLSDDIDGYVFFHSRDFYDKGYLANSIKDFEFYASYQNPPCIQLNIEAISRMKSLMKELVNEYTDDQVLKWQKVHSIINLVYIEIARVYSPGNQVNSEKYLLKVRAFEDLIEENYKQVKFAKDYASMLNITEKHLNRITKNCLNKTSSQLISERILLEAKRMLMHSKLNVTEVSEELGFNESSYFIRFFKKHTDLTPLHFLHRYMEKDKSQI
ncbi:MAG: helix-turn-helix domain-containing protein [Flavobacteriales bacterium]|nr:helix-turn-helix domain-containing protein [Flavobacteriales bacterium]